ncbi:bifunctional 4-hydroxy-2-oxoglutarate aldolase/2-dehydro-3-deoxy-phosphogluconate aldolase [Bacilliculturomica massiliensis]|uniref:bifunctional 4-hydroxy-2-oxoglutarate aldolase/2-dehydro-3-deoxy-phosphogluconate aldolase n=1 Tax=Bacilliculturomica massiliensis TaxID=1917867 RepID=UPI0013EF1E46|nr:bifunctional 4-hydroxy-2-oxoglutarate aldolase/2-dehydro-3-deoxy-phosphogluconate aldolase [Bacilliculturomica massiliensis]
MNQTMEKLNQIGMIPVVKLEDISKALPLARALTAGGIPAAEVTFRASGAEKVIAQLRESFPDMVVGAGTVLNIRQAVQAIDAGALYIVSPGLNPEIVSFCQEKNIPVIPGCATPTELERAVSLGVNVVKFFPAEQNGGLAGIKALCGPYDGVRFIPTGGVNLRNLSDYLSHPRIFACGGTFMAPPELIEKNDWDGIAALCRSAVDETLGITPCGSLSLLLEQLIGVTPASEDQTPCDHYEKEVSCLQITVNSLPRACYWLKQKGIEVLDPALEEDAGVSHASVLIKGVPPFSIRLIQKQRGA